MLDEQHVENALTFSSTNGGHIDISARTLASSLIAMEQYYSYPTHTVVDTRIQGYHDIIRMAGVYHVIRIYQYNSSNNSRCLKNASLFFVSCEMMVHGIIPF